MFVEFGGLIPEYGAYILSDRHGSKVSRCLAITKRSQKAQGFGYHASHVEDEESSASQWGNRG
jgi:hypothetical protein